MKMKTTLLMCLLLVSGANGNVSGSNPSSGACLCISGTGVNIRGAACGGVIGSESNGKCYKYSGSKNTCSLGGTNYEFFGFDYGGRTGWAAGNFLDLADNSRCGGGGSSPGTGACICVTGNGVNIRSSACGGVIGSANSGQCYKSLGSKTTCSLSGQSYEFLQFSYGGGSGWAAGNFLSVSSDSSRCDGGGGGGGTTAANEYTCEVRDQGKRIHETTSKTPYDCVDYSCSNTCKGGQCVAYVTCRCKRNGKWAPNTSCWRPGRKLKGSDGKCNRNIKANTAIATFTSAGRYYAGHACVFIRCVDDYTAEVYDQWCGRSIDYTKYSSSHRFYPDFATITSPGCADRGSWPCRVENSGPSTCPAGVKGC